VSVPPPPARVLRVCDTECYRNYWLCKFYDPAADQYHSFTLNAWTPLDRAGLMAMLQTSTIVTFNGIKYDEPMITAALAGFNNANLKALSDAIILRNLQPWQVEQEFRLEIPRYIDQIDLIEVMPGIASLKQYGARMHTKQIQDLPIEPGATLTPADMEGIADYCSVDLRVTWAAFSKFKTEIELREILGAETGIDLRSKSDAQIAEAIFRASAPYKIYPPTIPGGTQFYYATPAFVKFETLQLQTILSMVQRSPFTIKESTGSPEMTDELAHCRINIGGSTYQMGSGGLHSTEHNKAHIADATHSLSDWDVVSYYPKIISILGLYPPQLGTLFLDMFRGWIDSRIAAKRAGNKRKANGEKTKINGTFGKTGSKYSVLYAPALMIQTTITGQLCLLMLIESLELAGIGVVSANTDGIVIKCPRTLHDARDALVRAWESLTGFETEHVEYRALFSRDVNNYIAFKDDGVKLKGAFAPPEPIGPSWPNPSNEICVDAVIAFILDGVPVADTIRRCNDIRKFVSVRNVKGGGNWRQAADALPMYLGKTVRWYYATGCEASSINYVSNGNNVARSATCKPCMTLPDVLPPDINYAWYVSEANDLLKDLNVY
jgi:hypothetical protein